MNRIVALGKIINKCKCIFDVGSDHALLSVYLLKHKKCHHVVNIENKRQPLQNGIKNLEKYHLLTKTTNILNNGLYQIDKKIALKPTYIVCSGLGAKTIINILKKCNRKVHATLLLLPHKNIELLRKWLITHSFVIKNELTFCDAKKFYQILIVKFFDKKNNNYSSNYYYFGKKDHQISITSWKKMLFFNKNKIITNNLHLYNPQYNKMLKIINSSLASFKNEN